MLYAHFCRSLWTPWPPTNARNNYGTTLTRKRRDLRIKWSHWYTLPWHRPGTPSSWSWWWFRKPLFCPVSWFWWAHRRFPTTHGFRKTILGSFRKEKINCFISLYFPFLLLIYAEIMSSICIKCLKPHPWGNG